MEEPRHILVLGADGAVGRARVAQARERGWRVRASDLKWADGLTALKGFDPTGGEITGEFLMSIGYLPCPHREDCPVYAEIARLDPPWKHHGDA